ncbi:M28 family peptidase [Peribacillus frigoritolerans]|uniref:M28 family peptidase n=1 Tax=Peribacillus frigoritolerans TaxID=450367 RepID=UPI002EC27BCB|nr:M28 family peptidase [Peribacillus frigoritolerans]
MEKKNSIRTVLGRKTLTILLYIFSLIFLSLVVESPPDPQVGKVPVNEFSADRAMKHINQIAEKPHPTGTRENEKVRQYIVGELDTLGLKTKVETYDGFLKTEYFKGNIQLSNVIGILEGTGEGKEKILMVSAHYDSVPTAPGANDNGVSVASLLETARVLKSEAPLKNDIWFVFTDAEEPGMLGAEVFWKSKQHRENIGLVINFEARGSKGASMMYQTSNENGVLIREFAKSAPKPSANSFMGDLYNILPNDTDLTVSMREGIPGLNFAYIDGWEAYHTPMDSVENVNGSSLQSQGDNVLSMSKHFGSSDLSNLRSTNEVYFNFFGILIHYSEALVIPLTLLLGAIFSFLCFYSGRKGLISVKGISLSLLSVGLTIIISAVVSLILCKVIFFIWADRMTLFNGATYDSMLYAISFLIITLIVNVFISKYFRFKVTEIETVMSGMSLFYVLLLIVTFYLPGASYLFAFPLIVHSIIIGFSLTRKNPIKIVNRTITIMLFAFFPVVLFTDVFHLLFIGLSPYLNISGVVLMSLILAIIEPIKSKLSDHRRIFNTIAVTIILVLLGTGWVNSNWTPNRPVYQDENIILKE